MSAHVPPPAWTDPLAHADADRQRHAFAGEIAKLAERARALGLPRAGEVLRTLSLSVEEGYPA